jgi:hypothetical protein
VHGRRIERGSRCSKINDIQKIGKSVWIEEAWNRDVWMRGVEHGAPMKMREGNLRGIFETDLEARKQLNTVRELRRRGRGTPLAAGCTPPSSRNTGGGPRGRCHGPCHEHPLQVCIFLDHALQCEGALLAKAVAVQFEDNQLPE